MKRTLLIMLTLIILFPLFVKAESCNEKDITIDSIEVLQKSKSVEEVTPAESDGKNVAFNLQMENLYDQIKYKIVLKNNSEEEYVLDEKTLELKSDYFDYDLELEDEDNVIESNDKKVVYYTIKYDTPVDFDSNNNGFYTEDNAMVLSVSLNQQDVDAINNPKTGENNFNIWYGVFAVVTIVTLIIFYKKRKNMFIPFLILSISVISLTFGIKALCSSGFKLESSIKIKNPMPLISPTCFVAGTKVLTNDGNKNIEDIAIGDIVLTYNEKEKKNEYKRVDNIINSSTTEIYTIQTNNNVIKVTGSHYFYVIGNGYVESKDLKVGDQLLNSNGNSEVITSITNNIYDSDVSVYNLEVEDNSNYYVGNGILTHGVYIAQNGKLRIPLKVDNTKKNNSYNIKIPVRVEYNASPERTNDTFTFSITPMDNAPVINGSNNGIYYFSILGKPNKTVTTEVEVQVDFDGPGTYKYKIEVLNNLGRGFTYDDVTYSLEVKVGEENGSVEAKLLMEGNGKKNDSADFSFSYEEAPVPPGH